MGRLIKGQWSTEWYAPDEAGRFVRDDASFRIQFSARGASPLPEAAGRYHLYVSLACPWAHRTLIVRKLRRLEDAISVSIVDPLMGDEGWRFTQQQGRFADTVNGKQYLRDVYVMGCPDYTGRVTVPVLWDCTTDRIVCNESRDIMRLLDWGFEAWADATMCFCPAAQQSAIDAEIDALYQPINNGVYRAGFARTQQAYDEAVSELFAALDGYEQRLGHQRYLLGATITEADWCLFTTLVRFDLVYHYHFKCNLRRIQDYPNLWGFVRDLYQQPGVRDTCDFEHIRAHYYRSHESINPDRIVPIGPHVDFDAPHDRQRFAV